LIRLDAEIYFSGAPSKRPRIFYWERTICSVRLVVQQPAAEYAYESCADEKVEQREILQNGRHGLLLLISSGHNNTMESPFVPRRSCSCRFSPVACGEGFPGFFKRASGKP